jgi:hypothetical protein
MERPMSQPFYASKSLDADEESLLKLLHRCRKEADQAGLMRRVVVTYEQITVRQFWRAV